MKPVTVLLAVLSIWLLAPHAAHANTPPVAEPGHYVGKDVTFTLEPNGQIRNLHFKGKLVAHHAADIENQRHFKFRHRAAPIYVYHGLADWSSATICHGTINTDIPIYNYYGPAHSWTAHLEHTGN